MMVPPIVRKCSGRDGKCACRREIVDRRCWPSMTSIVFALETWKMPVSM